MFIQNIIMDIICLLCFVKRIGECPNGENNLRFGFVHKSYISSFFIIWLIVINRFIHFWHRKWFHHHRVACFCPQGTGTAPDRRRRSRGVPLCRAFRRLPTARCTETRRRPGLGEDVLRFWKKNVKFFKKKMEKEISMEKSPTQKWHSKATKIDVHFEISKSNSRVQTCWLRWLMRSHRVNESTNVFWEISLRFFISIHTLQTLWLVECWDRSFQATKIPCHHDSHRTLGLCSDGLFKLRYAKICKNMQNPTPNCSKLAPATPQRLMDRGYLHCRCQAHRSSRAQWRWELSTRRKQVSQSQFLPQIIYIVYSHWKSAHVISVIRRLRFSLPSLFLQGCETAVVADILMANSG